MKSKITILFILLFTSISFSANFIKSSMKESEKAKVIFAFDNDSKKLVGIINFEAINGKYGESLIKNYKNTTFFLGYIEGGFEQKNGEINPLQGSILTIIKDRNSTLYDKADPQLWFSPKTKTSKFLNNENFPNQEFTVYFSYTSWSCKWRGFLKKIDNEMIIINVI